MKKKVLTEKAIYFGKPSMPKGYEIDNESLFVDIAGSNAYDIKFPYSKPWQLLTTYVTEHINLHFGISICNAETWGEVIYPNKKCKILKAPTSYANHFVLLYGVKIKPKSTYVKIFVDGGFIIHEIKEGEFLIFPSDFKYTFIKNKSDKINFIQTIIYERI